MVYNKDRKLDYIHHDEGLVEVSGTSYSYEYYLKDHLGNTRILFNSSGGVMQRNDYYPFGMSAGMAYSNSTDNKYLYNGKELQDELGLGWYDYGARFYDPTLGRFTTSDPLAENYNFQTNYAYAANNPILMVDFMGMGPDSTATQAGSFSAAFEQTMNRFAGTVLSILDDPRNLSTILDNIVENPGEVLQQTVEGSTQTVENLLFGTPAQQGEAAANGLLMLGTYELFKGLTEVGKPTNCVEKPQGPTEAYNRSKHYGNTPTATDRKVLGAGKDEVVDHKTPLVQHYYEGDGQGGKPGYLMTSNERKAFAKDRSRMQLQSRSESNIQGAKMSNYAKQQKKKYGPFPL